MKKVFLLESKTRCNQGLHIKKQQWAQQISKLREYTEQVRHEQIGVGLQENGIDEQHHNNADQCRQDHPRDSHPPFCAHDDQSQK